MRNFLPPFTLPDQTGRTWLVTGATNGLGKEVAVAAAGAGAHVVIAARDTVRADRVQRELGTATVLPLDLADLSSVRAAADSLDRPVDVLVNNAGTVSGDRKETVDGFELMLGTNVLGPFAFTNLVLPRVRERVVIVGSGAHRWRPMDFDDPHFRRRRFSFIAGYGQSKLADMLWGLGLSHRLATAARETGAARVQVQLAHPGWAHTNLQNHSPWPAINKFVGYAAHFGGQSAADGAQNVLVAATGRLPECSYVGPSGRGELKGPPALVGRSHAASDPRLAGRFWDFASQATATDFPASRRP